jgi:hypothetical protein
VLVVGKRLTVFSIREGKNGLGKVWTRAGNAVVNKDGSLNLWLDVLPLDGVLHVRQTAEKQDNAPSESPAPEAQPLAAAAGGH